jgi:hypothetical protein
MAERITLSQQTNVEQENVFLPRQINSDVDPEEVQEPARTTSDVIFPSEDRLTIERKKQKSYVDQLKEQIGIHEEQLDFFILQRAKNVMLQQAFQPQVSTENTSVTDFVAAGISDLLEHEEESHDKMADKIREKVIPKATTSKGEKNGTGDYRTDDVPMLNIYAEAHHVMAGIARAKHQDIIDSEGIVLSPTHYLAQSSMNEALEPAVIEAHDAFDSRISEIAQKKAIKITQIATVRSYLAQGDTTQYLQHRVVELEGEVEELNDELRAIDHERNKVFGRFAKMQEEIAHNNTIFAHEDEFSE